jgi:hypothetical protein
MLCFYYLLLQDNPNQAALLRCLSRLDVDTWAQVLLPKLIAQGSARDITLTCSELRDLCFGAAQCSTSTSAVCRMMNRVP